MWPRVFRRACCAEFGKKWTMPRQNRNVGQEILDGLREFRRGEIGRVVNVLDVAPFARRPGCHKPGLPPSSACRFAPCRIGNSGVAHPPGPRARCYSLPISIRRCCSRSRSRTAGGRSQLAPVRRERVVRRRPVGAAGACDRARLRVFPRGACVLRETGEHPQRRLAPVARRPEQPQPKLIFASRLVRESAFASASSSVTLPCRYSW